MTAAHLTDEDRAILRACLTRNTPSGDPARIAALVNAGLLLPGSAQYRSNRSYETTRAGREELER